MISLEGIIILCTICSTAMAQDTENNNSNFIIENKLVFGCIFLLIILIIAIYLDKRNGYKYITIIRLKSGQMIQRIKSIGSKGSKNKKQKIQTEQSIPTSKQMRNIFDSEKTFVEGAASAHQTIVCQKNNEQMISNMQMEQDTPKVNLKQVFQQKNPQIKRSKSKIRSRVQIKKSQIQDEAIKDTLQFTDDNSNQANPNEE